TGWIEERSETLLRDPAPEIPDRLPDRPEEAERTRVVHRRFLGLFAAGGGPVTPGERTAHRHRRLVQEIEHRPSSYAGRGHPFLLDARCGGPTTCVQPSEQPRGVSWPRPRLRT